MEPLYGFGNPFGVRVVDALKYPIEEIDSDLADVLLSFLTLPLGQIVRVLKKHYGDEAPAVGSLTTLYNGLANLCSAHFVTEGCKEMILNPRSWFEAQCRKLKVDLSDAQPTRFFTCENLKCVYRHSNVSMLYDVARCPCGKGTLKREIGIIDDESVVAADHNGVFTNKTASFVISDDLSILPNVSVSIMKTLMNLGIYGSEMDDAELRNVTIGFNEVIYHGLTQGLTISKTPLTDLILKKTNISNSPRRFYSRPIIEKETSSSNSKKMSLKLIVQKCNNKLLFAQAGGDFVDFLFSMLTVPLVGAQCLLGYNGTGLHGVNGLYYSIAYDIENKYLASADIKTMFMKPKLPHDYLPKNQILPLSEQSAPQLYYNRDAKMDKEWLSCTSGQSIGYRKGEGAYVKGPTMYMITDDLTVTPLTLTSSFSFLNELKIPFSDVKEVDVQIGSEQALNIMKASLASTFALTDGLGIDFLLEEKQPQRKRKAVSVSKKKATQEH